MPKAAGRVQARRARAIAAAVVFLLLAALIVVGWRTRPWASPVMTVTVTLSADGEETPELYHRKAIFSTSSGHPPLLREEIDLTSWAGKLVRLDVKGEPGPRSLWPRSTKYVACSAELLAPESTVPVEFVGWENDGSKGTHRGTIGCPASVAPSGDGAPFAYTTQNHLWHVLRVPEGAALKLALKLVRPDEAGESPQPVIAESQPERVRETEWSRDSSQPKPDVFIYLIDALRADHLGCYGHSRGTSPAIDAFARDATLYEQVQTAATWTRPSVATLLTGLYSSAHGVFHRKWDVLPEWPVVLSEVLHDAGYATFAASANAAVNQRWGFDQGFSTFAHERGESAPWVKQQAEAFLNERVPKEPVFLYLHTMEPHAPYAPSAESFRRFDRGFTGSCDGSKEALKAAPRIHPQLSSEDIAHLVDLYDAEIFDADRGFAEFLDLLRESGRLEHALIMLVADHGEAFAEHDTLEHGCTLNREELHVPLIIRWPQGQFAGVRVKERVSLADVFPTVLNAVGVRPRLGYGIPGRDLVEGAIGSSSTSERRIYAEVSRDKDDRLDLVGVIDEDGYKSAVDMSVVPGEVATRKSVGLWDTKKDPTETVDLRESLPVRASYHEQLIARWLVEQRHWCDASTREADSEVEFTEEMREDLESLGYLD